MPNFKKSSGFKMSGYSYPGKSPMKGKRKNAELAAAAESKAAATAKMEEFGDMKMKSTDILGKGSFKVDAPAAPTKSIGSAIIGALKTAGKAVGKEALKSAPEAIIGGAVSAGINAIGKKKEKPERKSADIKGFSGIQMGRK